jgi:hypothetical protein
MQRSRISIRGEIRLDRIGKRGDEQLVQLMQPYTLVHQASTGDGVAATDLHRFRGVGAYLWMTEMP